jgi:arylamine N-acetyltransferase
MERDLFTRYLCLLGIRKQKPTIEFLNEIVNAHMSRIPFENLSKLYYLKQLGLRSIPDLRLFLEGIEKHNFGGTCYSNNYFLNQLLQNLGYKVILCGADMSEPDVHTVSIVTVEQKQYLVDVGYAAPFMSPMPRDLITDHIISLGRDKYVLKPQDDRGCSCLEFYRAGKIKHGYVVKPAARQIRDFEKIIKESFRPDATFMNSLLLAKFFSHGSMVVHNLTVIESQGTASSIQKLSDREELTQFIVEQFGISRLCTSEALNGLAMKMDAWS